MPLAVIRGLTYFDVRQVFNRWLIPTYQTAFRWTGNRSDSEDATSWALSKVVGHVRLPELVQVVDDHVVDATLEAVVGHWTHRYGLAEGSSIDIHAAELIMPDRAMTLEALFEGLSAQMRLILVLRFLRHRSVRAIATQLKIRPDAARKLMLEALAGVTEQIGFAAGSRPPAQAVHVSAYVDDIVRGRKPVRFEVLREAWPALVGASHIQAAVAGNSLPEARFVRSLERRLVTSLRIWTA